MIAYVDASVVLRLALAQPDPLQEWSRVTAAYASRLTELECLRTIDRMRVTGVLSDADVVRRLARVEALLQHATLVEVSTSILHRAGKPLPIALGSLDALHLATVQRLRARRERSLTLATHDVGLARAAVAVRVPMIGVPEDRL